MDNIFNIIINLIVFVPIILIFSILPYITRKDIMFGITIPPSEWKNDYFKKLRKSYVTISIVSGVIFLTGNAISSALLSEQLSVVFMQVLLWSALLVYFLLYLFFWIKTKKYKEKANWIINAKNVAVADTKTDYKKRSLSPMWFLVYLVLILVTYFGALQLFELAPNMIPVRYDINGDPSVFQPKSLRIVYQMIGMQVFIGVLFFIVNFTITRAKKTIDPANPEESSIKNDVMKYRWSIFLFVTGLLMLLIFAQALFSMFVTMPVWAILYMPMGATLIILAYAIILAVKTGQSGSKIKSSIDKKTGTEITRDDDSLWKLGMFYYNKDDPAVFIEKRFGAGWTNNWARWQSWLFIGIIVCIIVVTALFST